MYGATVVYFLKLRAEGPGVARGKNALKKLF